MNDIDPTPLDLYGILTATRDAPRDAALRVRNALRELLRAVEDMHDFPHSFQTKAEKDDTSAPHGLRKDNLIDRKHYNR